MIDQILITIIGGIITFIFTGIFTALVTAWVTSKKLEMKHNNVIFRLTTIEADVKTVKAKQGEYLERIHKIENNVIQLSERHQRTN